MSAEHFVLIIIIHYNQEFLLLMMVMNMREQVFETKLKK